MSLAAAGTTYEEVADQVVRGLASAGWLPRPVRPTPWAAFARLSDLVHGRFVVPSTTFTPVMRRLAFALGFAARPRHVIGIGTYVAYTFSWLLRRRGDPEAAPYAERALAVDLDPQATLLASRNTAVLDHGSRLRCLASDGVAALARAETPIDLLYVDLDDPETGKAGYASVLRAARPHLAPGALVLAHDACVPRFQADLDAYHRVLRECGAFSGPCVLPLDACGLSVALRRRDA